MKNTATCVSKHIAMLVRGASLNLVVLMLAACGDAQPYYLPTSSPPTSNPPTSNPPTPFVVVDVISLSTDDYGQTWVASVHGPIDNAQVTVDGRAADASALRNGDVAFIRGDAHLVHRGRAGARGDLGEDRLDRLAYHLVVGVVDSADPSHARLVVMGQQVTVTGDTIVFDRLVSEGALAAAQPGEIVAVSGFLHGVRRRGRDSNCAYRLTG